MTPTQKETAIKFAASSLKWFGRFFVLSLFAGAVVYLQAVYMMR